LLKRGSLTTDRDRVARTASVAALRTCPLCDAEGLTVATCPSCRVPTYRKSRSASALGGTSPGAARPKKRARLKGERLVEQLREGNEIAFEVLFDRHRGALLSFCRHLLGTLEEAEDAVQQTFLSPHRQLCAPGRRMNHLKPWLFTIARNRCISMLRSRRETPAADLPERVSVAGLSEQVEGREDVRELLAGKPRRLDSSARQADVRAMRPRGTRGG